MATNRSFRVVIFFVTSFLFSCCSSPQVGISSSPLIQPEKAISPETLISVLRERADKITTIKSSLSMTIQSRDIKQPKKMNGYIAISKPDKIRFKGFTFLGLELFDLAIMDDDFQLFIPSKNELYRGSREDVLNSPISMPLFPEDITLMFYSESYGSSHFKCREENDYYLLSLPWKDNGTLQRSKKMWIDKKNLTIVKMEIYSGQELETRYNFYHYKLIGENFFPYRIEIERVKDESCIKVQVSSIEINHAIDPEAFTIPTDAIKSIKPWGKTNN